jgi:hypothetical protein
VAETLQNVKSEDRPTATAFMRVHLIYTAMRRHYFPSFLQSDAYHQYLTKVVTATAAGAELHEGATALGRADQQPARLTEGMGPSQRRRR